MIKIEPASTAVGQGGLIPNPFSLKEKGKAQDII
jgi:hypothetical protein